MLAATIRDQRKISRLTQTEMAKQVGIQQTTVSDLKNRQYHFTIIQPRHLISTATMSVSDAVKLFMYKRATQAEGGIATVAAEQPGGFPEHISNAIFNGLSRQADKIMQGQAYL